MKGLEWGSGAITMAMVDSTIVPGYVQIDLNNLPPSPSEVAKQGELFHLVVSR